MVVFRIIKKIFFILFISHLSYVMLLRFFDAPITITQMASIISGDGFHRTHVSMHQLSRNAKLAVIASEDQLFPDHNGFDIKSIQKALNFNKKKKVKKSEVPRRLVSRLQKMFFCGKEEVGLEKG